ncbi:FAD-dependent oxidoreductase [Candidatus Poribacteria bacterium]
MAELITIQREVPVLYDLDVVVVGGGPTGVATAIAAARLGREVLLIEGMGCLGGIGTSAELAVFLGFSDGKNVLVGGVGREIRDKLYECGGFSPDSKYERWNWAVYQTEVLKRLYDDLITEAGIHLLLFTHLVDVERKGERVSSVILSSKSGLFAVRGKIFVDATGDGDLCAMAGVPFEKGDEQGRTQAPTLCSQLTGVDWERHREWRQQGGTQEQFLREAFEAGVLPYYDPHLPGIYQSHHNAGIGNVGHVYGVDGTDMLSLTQGMLKGRKLVQCYVEYYRKYIPGFEQAELVNTGALLGIRETRRILGDYVLNLEDFKRRAYFSDEIGRHSYPVDMHSPSPEAEDQRRFEEDFAKLRYEPGESYGIPYRCLIPRNVSNVLVGGRCFSADRYIQGSARVMSGCFIMGQAAGTAAAMAVERGVKTRDVNPAELREILRQHNAYLP